MNMVAACDGEGKCVIDEPDVFVDLFTQEIKELSKDSGVAESPIADCI